MEQVARAPAYVVECKKGDGSRHPRTRDWSEPLSLSQIPHQAFVAARDLSVVVLKRPNLLVAVVALFVIDIAFVLLHTAYHFGPRVGLEAAWLHNPRFIIDVDDTDVRYETYAEVFNYVQTAVAVVALALTALHSRERVYLAWSLVFAFVLADDALSYHERVGLVFVRILALPDMLGLRGWDFGETIAWAIPGIILFVVLFWACRRSSPDARRFSWLLTGVLALLVFFAFGVDMLHILGGAQSDRAGFVLGTAEDGGEMLALALACTCSILLYLHVRDRERSSS